MIFVGDIALPHNCNAVLKTDRIFVNKDTVANLEGCIVDEDYSNDKVIYNDRNVLEILKLINCRLVGLANNHIQDIPERIQKTVDILEESGIKSCGIDSDIDDQCFILDNSKYYILNYAWIITGIRNKRNREQISLLSRNRVTENIDAILKIDPKLKVICFFHWGYELECYPLPMDRQIAMDAIDAGAYAVIGCHSHCLQGIEVYKGKPIVYGLGNFFFPEGNFFDGKLAYPDIAHRELAFEIDNGVYKCHWFVYDTVSNEIRYEKTTDIESPEVNQITPYKNLSNSEYLKWFKRNRRKKVLLPVFDDANKTIMNRIKICWVQIRQVMILCLVKMQIKKGPR